MNAPSIAAACNPEIAERERASRARTIDPLGNHAVDRAGRLAAAALEAEQIRALAARPEVVALRIDRIRAQVDTLLWLGIGLGLLFTMVNVQRFAAAGAPTFSSTWWAAWLLDPMVSMVLLAVLRAEQVTSRYQVPLATWARRTKWCACAATYAMNTWEAWGLAGAPMSASGVILHSVPPLLVVLAAEAGPGLRERLTDAALLANHREPPGVQEAEPDGVHESSSAQVHETVGGPCLEASGRAQRETRRGGRARPGGPQRQRRRLFADYLAEARVAVHHATAQAGVPPEVTPSWCRRVTGCSAGTSVKLAAVLRDGEPP